MYYPNLLENVANTECVEISKTMPLSLSPKYYNMMKM